MLSKQSIEEYQKIMKEEFGQDISISEAEEQGIRLMNYPAASSGVSLVNY